MQALKRPAARLRTVQAETSDTSRRRAVARPYGRLAMASFVARIPIVVRDEHEKDADFASARARVDELKTQINHHNYRYQKGKPSRAA
jgi:hypothetical protein